jgi:hypothetical protein
MGTYYDISPYKDLIFLNVALGREKELFGWLTRLFTRLSVLASAHLQLIRRPTPLYICQN